MHELTFSQRMGLAQVNTEYQIYSMDKKLKNSLHNLFFNFYNEFNDDLQEKFVVYYWENILCNSAKRDYSELKYSIADHFLNKEYHEIYGFLEYFVDFCRVMDDYIIFESEDVVDKLNKVLDKNLSGYTFVDEVFIPIVDKIEIIEIETLLANSPFYKSRQGIKKAVKILSEEDCIYANVIKECINAAESAIRELLENDKITMGQGLKQLSSGSFIHNSFSEAWSKFYGYTSSVDGIRHGSSTDKNIDIAEATLFLATTSSFINYLARIKSSK